MTREKPTATIDEGIAVANPASTSDSSKSSSPDKPWLFKPGQSGNPGGRAPVDKTWRDKCREWAERTGWQKLQAIAERDGDREQVKAIELILAYAYGRPSANIDINVSPIRFEVVQRLLELPHDDVSLLAAEYRRALEAGEVVDAEIIPVSPKST